MGFLQIWSPSIPPPPERPACGHPSSSILLVSLRQGSCHPSRFFLWDELYYKFGKQSTDLCCCLATLGGESRKISVPPCVSARVWDLLRDMWHWGLRRSALVCDVRACQLSCVCVSRCRLHACECVSGFIGFCCECDNCCPHLPPACRWLLCLMCVNVSWSALSYVLFLINGLFCNCLCANKKRWSSD